MMKSLLTIVVLLFIALPCAVAQEGDTIVGKASYYADKFHGRKMSNGQKYHRDSLTCAHRKFPFGTMLRVKNLKNGREVEVRVTDRGPFTNRYIIDLSRAAARELDLIRHGFATVEITPFVPQCVPYRIENTLPEIPELNIEYSPIVVYPTPTWRDTLVVARKPSE